MESTQSQNSKAMRDRLAIVDPELSTELGTLPRKIIDAVAERLSVTSVDSRVNNYLFDINAYGGSDLDGFVSMFGFSRQKETQANGFVSLTRSDAPDSFVVGPGDQFYRDPNGTSPSLYFQSIAYVTMGKGVTSIDVPVIAVLGGALGNVPANSIRGSSTLANAISVTNPLPMSGGLDKETDEELRARFLKTIFRNIAGTQDQYVGLALANAFVSRANLVGQESLYTEILTIQEPVAGTFKATSTNPECAAVLDKVNAVWVRKAEDNSYYIEGVHYTLDTTALPPTVNVIKDGAVPRIAKGSAIVLDYKYLSKLNRGNNRSVELFVDGSNTSVVTDERHATMDDARKFVATAGAPMNVEKWLRPDGVTHPAVGNYFERLAFQPSMGLPDTIEFSGGIIKEEGVDYWHITDVTSDFGSAKAFNGIEWKAASLDPQVLPNPAYTISYPHNQVVPTIQELVALHSQVTSDCLVHSAVFRYFEVNIDVMYSMFPKALIDSEVETAIAKFFNSAQFGSIVQVSDILSVVHAVSGVDSVRLTDMVGAVGGIQEYATDGSTHLASFDTDFRLGGSELPVLLRINASSITQEVW